MKILILSVLYAAQPKNSSCGPDFKGLHSPPFTELGVFVYYVLETGGSDVE